MKDLEAFIQKLPKAELHLHIEGSLEPELMLKLAKRNQIKLPFDGVDELRAAYDFTNLQSFLDIYYRCADVLREEEDFFDLAMDYFQRCAKENIRHTEIFFDPQTHTQRGISFQTVMEGFKRAQQKAQSELGVSSHLILCFLRHLPEEDAYPIFEQAMDYKQDIIAFGLDSSEVGHPPEKYKNVFKKVLDAGFKTVAHAGEEGPPEYIEQALELLKVSRIDHGVRCLENQELTEFLARERIPLTVCPLSNVKLRVFSKLEDHNFKKLLEAGIRVTINSDDPAFFGGYLNQNFVQTSKAVGLSKGQIVEVAKNSFLASFVDDQQKQKWIQEIDDLKLEGLD